MRTLKSLLLLFAIAGVVMSSCSSNTPVVSPIATTIVSPTTLPTATFTYTPAPTDTPIITPTNTPIPTISKTRINLSPELYLDENSSPDNRGESNFPDYSYFRNGIVHGLIYHFGNEEWVVAEPETCIVPSNDVTCDSYVDGKLRAYYVQVWKAGELVYSVPVSFRERVHILLRYEDHWILSFGDDYVNEMWIVQDGIMLNDLYDYDTAFSLSLLDGKPFFFFQRGDQFGISFRNEGILLPYSDIVYAPFCCEGGGSRNPGASDTKVGFYGKREDSDYQYVEIGLR